MHPASCSADARGPTSTFTSFARACGDLHTSGDACINSKQKLSGCTDFQQGISHCKARIAEGLRNKSQSLYIGITGDPKFRWDNEEFGHRLKNRWSRMNVLLEGDADITRAIETALVKYYHDDDELRDGVMNHISNPSGWCRAS